MRATLQFVIDSFDYFNKYIFESKLPHPDRFVISKAKSFLGRLEYKYRYSARGELISHYDYTMRISSAVDKPKDFLEDIIIHEMIHLYIAVNMLNDKTTHGNTFRTIMKTINMKYGRHIAISHRIDDAEKIVSSAYRIICVITLASGGYGVTVCAKTRVFVIRRELQMRYRIVKMEWYYSNDDFFAIFKRSNTGRAYNVTAEELKSHLSDARELVCDGFSLRFK